MPVRLRPADPAVVGPALARFRDGAADRDDLRLLTKHLLALLVAKAPGGAVEVRVPPYAAAQCLTGTRHTRGTPPAAVEMDAATWIALGTGDLDWAEAERDGRLLASGERSGLGPLLPLLTVE
ncbi:sterol carrier family protein [Nocardioides panacis]|uniref:sterol carrier family protein n=1 Tax=Nocardioides panacis TaxID=2849501 RepID=UPI0020B2E17A|nr:sterol carrier family protein [Nocardioides panacis]